MIIKNLTFNSKNISFQVDDINEKEKGVFLARKVDNNNHYYDKKEIKRMGLFYNISLNDEFLPFLSNQNQNLFEIISVNFLSGVVEKISFEENINKIEFSLPLDKQEVATITICGYTEENTLKISSKITQKKDVKLVKVEETNNYFDFYFNKKFATYNFYLAKRKTKVHLEKYTRMVKCNTFLNGNFTVVRINKSGGFKGACLNGGEIWELVMEFSENRFACCITNETFNFNYYRENKLLEVKPFVSDNCYIAFWTKLNNTNKRIKIAVCGSCYSREVFHSIDYLNIDYKKWYDVVYTAFHSSIISIMSQPLNIQVNKKENSPNIKLINLYANNEFNKTFFKDLEKSKPDYIIIDLFIEANETIFEIDDKHYITNSFYLNDVEEFINLKKQKKLTINDETRFELFQKTILQFREKISHIIPLDKIILISCRPAIKKLINYKISDWENKDWLNMSIYLWERNDLESLKTIPEAKVVDMTDYDVFSTDKSPLNLSTNHFQSEYYKEVLNKINKIILSDQLSK